MAAFDWSKYATGGALRPDSFSGMDPSFLSHLQAMFEGAPPDIQANLRVFSGYRSPDKQEQLWEAALKKYGSPDVARKWVAPPGHSNHNHGDAADLRFLDPQALAWAHQHASDYGLNFPLANENWHIEPVGIRGGGHPAPAPMDPGTVATNITAGAAPSAVPAPSVEVAGAPAPGKTGALSGLFAALAPVGGAGAVGIPATAGPGQPAAEMGSGDPMGGANAAAAAAQKARGLAAGLAPNVDLLMGLGKRPNGSLTA